MQATTHMFSYGRYLLLSGEVVWGFHDISAIYQGASSYISSLDTATEMEEVALASRMAIIPAGSCSCLFNSVTGKTDFYSSGSFLVMPSTISNTTVSIIFGVLVPTDKISTVGTFRYLFGIQLVVPAGESVAASTPCVLNYANNILFSL